MSKSKHNINNNILHTSYLQSTLNIIYTKLQNMNLKSYFLACLINNETRNGKIITIFF